MEKGNDEYDDNGIEEKMPRKKIKKWMQNEANIVGKWKRSEKEYYKDK